MPLISMHGLVLKFKCKVKDYVPIPQFFIMVQVDYKIRNLFILIFEFLLGCLQDLNSQWRPVKKGITEYFTLGDLWECYDEWSAYGAGTPVALNNGENIVQYYVPYLSAIQIYVNKSSAISRNPRYDTDPVEFEVDSWSDDNESDKFSRSLSNNSSKAWDATLADSSIDHEGALPMKDRLGNLYFEYYDTCSPYWRILLMDKVINLFCLVQIIEFAQTYPGLMTLKNVDLSTASWIAVAWCVTPYPQKCCRGYSTLSCCC
ncbi:hypothetical protein RJ639_004811 [Escallonia herrerae]|uniref:Uncharacterized protein n=1 Tax=Escallonia herrerae TaxID=1293975 RepID=A0AA88W511_9ASTE|nr:hypothetical protein RJ639_004811 [Escallonia herrerae]